MKSIRERHGIEAVTKPHSVPGVPLRSESGNTG